MLGQALGRAAGSALTAFGGSGLWQRVGTRLEQQTDPQPEPVEAQDALEVGTDSLAAPQAASSRVSIFPDGSACPGDGLPVNIVKPGGRALLVGIGGNQAGDEELSERKVPTGDACGTPDGPMRPMQDPCRRKPA